MNQTSTRLKAQDHSKPDQETYPMPYVVGLIIGVILFAITIVIARAHNLSGFQLSVFHFFNNWSNIFKLPALWLSEGLGAGYPIAICVLVPLYWKLFRLSWRFFVTVGGTGVVMEIGKMIAKEPRPVVMLHNSNLHVRAVELGLTSYPSGHVAVATAMAMTLWLILPKAWRWVSPVWILVVAVSRVYLGVHTPNDVLGGFAIGLVCVCVVRLLPHALAKTLHLDLDKPLTSPGW
jgi:glycosyltransferase 2 family protein